MTGAAEDVPELYRRHAEAWANARSQALFERAWLDSFLSLLGDDRTVLDVGCGSGAPIARYLSDQGCPVTGVDSSPELLTLAEASVPSGRWIHHDMRTLDLDERFAGILAWHSLFHLSPDDQRSMFPVFANHADDAAVLMFTSGSQHGTTIGSLEGDLLYHASLDTEEYEDLLNDNGFAVVRHVDADPDCGNATVWMATTHGTRTR